MYKTFQYRIKDRSYIKELIRMSSVVNYVWNCCNEISNREWRENKKWISKIDIQKYFKGKSKELKLSSRIILLTAVEHAYKRKQFKKAKLKWRSRKRSLTWIPLDLYCFSIKYNLIKIGKTKFKIWKSRELEGKIKTADITQNAKGDWFINIVCECINEKSIPTNYSIGIDLGFKETVVCSDGKIYISPKPLRFYEDKLAKAQRAKKHKLVTNIHQKISNIRKDFNHKTTTEIVKNNDVIFVGGVSSQAMIKRGKGFAKSAIDASWGQFRTMLDYKAKRLGKVFLSINEAWSSCTCSVCNERSGPRGLSQLGVRSWVCNNCGTKHDRDINAAINIHNFGAGLSSPIQEILLRK